jgi:prophage DNA circulation protein
MHPSEMKNSALVAAAKAKKDGFSGTAAALFALAEACAEEARELSEQTDENTPDRRRYSPQGRAILVSLSY